MNEITKVDASFEKRRELQAVIDKFLRSLDVKPNSIRTYARGLKQFAEWLNAQGDIPLTRESILAYKNYLHAKNVSALTISNYLVAVRRLFEFTEAEKIFPNIAKNIKGCKRARSFRKDPLTIEQVHSLLNSFNLSSKDDLRNFAIVNLLLRAGLRTIELVRADLGDISQQAGEAVLWVQGKNCDTKDQFVLLTEASLKPIRDYLASRGSVKEADPLFVSHSDRNKNKRLTTRSISRIVKEQLKKIAINDPRLTAHSLRHTAITLALQGGATLQEAQALGRHQDISVTLIYAHNTHRVRDAAEKKIDAILSRGLNDGNQTAQQGGHV